jgi:drug/metabolite transporter (DMT)-like permease
MTYVLAVLAACANAVSSVMQRKANRRTPKGQNMSLRLIWNLLHQPAWFGGVLAVIAGFLLQAGALGSGQLSVVEPILVLELPVTLLLASRVFRTRLHRREWGAAAAITVGLAGVLYFLSPSGGHAGRVSWWGWAIGIGVSLGFIAALAAWGRRGPAGAGPRDDKSEAMQAALLGVAAGASFGLTAALMKGMTTTFSRGITALFTSWQLYAMIAAGGLAMFLLQSALNAGRLVAVQPALTMTDPIVSVLWGVLIFGERVRGGWYIGLAVLSGLVIAAAIVALAGSPLLSDQPDRSDPADVAEAA